MINKSKQYGFLKQLVKHKRLLKQIQGNNNNKGMTISIDSNQNLSGLTPPLPWRWSSLQDLHFALNFLKSSPWFLSNIWR